MHITDTRKQYVQTDNECCTGIVQLKFQFPFFVKRVRLYNDPPCKQSSIITYDRLWTIRKHYGDAVSLFKPQSLEVRRQLSCLGIDICKCHFIPHKVKRFLSRET